MAGGEQRLQDALARERLERRIRGIYLAALNDLAANATDTRTLRVVRQALEAGNSMRLAAHARSSGASA